MTKPWNMQMGAFLRPFRTRSGGDQKVGDLVTRVDGWWNGCLQIRCSKGAEAEFLKAPLKVYVGDMKVFWSQSKESTTENS